MGHTRKVGRGVGGGGGVRQADYYRFHEKSEISKTKFSPEFVEDKRKRQTIVSWFSTL